MATDVHVAGELSTLPTLSSKGDHTSESEQETGGGMVNGLTGDSEQEMLSADETVTASAAPTTPPSTDNNKSHENKTVNGQGDEPASKQSESGKMPNSANLSDKKADLQSTPTSASDSTETKSKAASKRKSDDMNGELLASQNESDEPKTKKAKKKVKEKDNVNKVCTDTESNNENEQSISPVKAKRKYVRKKKTDESQSSSSATKEIQSPKIKSKKGSAKQVTVSKDSKSVTNRSVSKAVAKKVTKTVKNVKKLMNTSKDKNNLTAEGSKGKTRNVKEGKIATKIKSNARKPVVTKLNEKIKKSPSSTDKNKGSAKVQSKKKLNIDKPDGKELNISEEQEKNCQTKTEHAMATDKSGKKSPKVVKKGLKSKKQEDPEKNAEAESLNKAGKKSDSKSGNKDSGKSTKTVKKKVVKNLTSHDSDGSSNKEQKEENKTKGRSKPTTKKDSSADSKADGAPGKAKTKQARSRKDKSSSEADSETDNGSDSMKSNRPKTESSGEKKMDKTSARKPGKSPTPDAVKLSGKTKSGKNAAAPDKKARKKKNKDEELVPEGSEDNFEDFSPETPLPGENTEPFLSDSDDCPVKASLASSTKSQTTESMPRAASDDAQHETSSPTEEKEVKQVTASPNTKQQEMKEAESETGEVKCEVKQNEPLPSDSEGKVYKEATLLSGECTQSSPSQVPPELSSELKCDGESGNTDGDVVSSAQTTSSNSSTDVPAPETKQMTGSTEVPAVKSEDPPVASDNQLSPFGSRSPRDAKHSPRDVPTHVNPPTLSPIHGDQAKLPDNKLEHTETSESFSDNAENKQIMPQINNEGHVPSSLQALSMNTMESGMLPMGADPTPVLPVSSVNQPDITMGSSVTEMENSIQAMEEQLSILPMNVRSQPPPTYTLPLSNEHVELKPPPFERKKKKLKKDMDLEDSALSPPDVDSQDHVIGRSGERTFDCRECNYQGKHKAALLKHLKILHGIFQCSHCDFSCATKEGMDDHMKETHPTSKWGKRKCTKCCRFLTQEEYENHDDVCSGKMIPYTCEYCNKEFRFKNLMLQHAKTHMESKERKKFSCQECDFTSCRAGNVEQHYEALHSENRPKDTPCPECGKLFYNNSLMMKHRKENCKVITTHACDKCDKVFKSLHALKNHQLTHNTEATVPCGIDGCTELFRTNRHLTYHKKFIHGIHPAGKTQKVFQCSYPDCEEEFSKKNALKRHEAVHSGVRQYPCDFPGCGKAFRHADNLKVHYLQHTKEKPVKCEHCDYACRQKSALRHHMKTRHPEIELPTRKRRPRKPTYDSEETEEEGMPPGASDKDVYDFDDDEFGLPPLAKTAIRSPRHQSDTELSGPPVFSDEDIKKPTRKYQKKKGSASGDAESGSPKKRKKKGDMNSVPEDMAQNKSSELGMPGTHGMMSPGGNVQGMGGPMGHHGGHMHHQQLANMGASNHPGPGLHQQTMHGMGSESESSQMHNRGQRSAHDPYLQHVLAETMPLVDAAGARSHMPPMEQPMAASGMPRQTEDRRASAPSQVLESPPSQVSEPDMQGVAMPSVPGESPGQKMSHDYMSLPRAHTDGLGGDIADPDSAEAVADQMAEISDEQLEKIAQEVGENMDVPISGEEMHPEDYPMPHSVDEKGYPLPGLQPHQTPEYSGPGSNVPNSADMNPPSSVGSVPHSADVQHEAPSYPINHDNSTYRGQLPPEYPSDPATATQAQRHSTEADLSAPPSAHPDSHPDTQAPSESSMAGYPRSVPPYPYSDDRSTNSTSSPTSYPNTTSSYSLAPSYPPLPPYHMPPYGPPTYSESESATSRREESSLPTEGVQAGPEAESARLSPRSSESMYTSTTTSTTTTSSTASTFPTDSFPGRELLGQYFQDPSTLPLTHPPVGGQDQRSPYLPGQQTAAGLSMLRRPPMMPGSTYSSMAETLAGTIPPPLPGQQPGQQSWLGHDERSRTWGQPSPMLVPGELGTGSPLSSSRNPYSERPEYPAFDPNSSRRPGESGFVIPQSLANSTQPTYDIPSIPSAYMSSRSALPSATDSSYNRTVPSTGNPQNRLEDAYRHVSDYRTLSQGPPSMADMYRGVGMNPTFAGLDKYYYPPRDPMYRSQHIGSAPNPFLPPSSSSQMGYSEREYSRNAAMYPQPSAYGFMSDKQYLSSSKLAAGMPSAAEYFQPRPPGPSGPHMQDPYSRIYNMMRYY